MNLCVTQPTVPRREFLPRAGAGLIGLDSSAEVNRAYWSEPLESACGK
jgi:hypothetical protein